VRCHAETPYLRPDDDAWQQAWQTLVAPLTSTTVGPDGMVDVPDSTSLRLVSGTHLAPAATYRIAEDRVRSGQLEMTIGDTDRDLNVTWSPFTTTGRAELVVHGLDRFVEVRARARLRHLKGDFLLAPARDEPVRLRLRLDWLAVDFTARVTAGPAGDLLVGDLAVRGVGLWRPPLAPLLAAVHGKVANAFADGMRDLAQSLAQPELELYDASPDFVEPNRFTITPAEAEAQIRRGFEEVERRLRSVAAAVAALPWWRRTARGWRRTAAALPPGTWPSDHVLGGGSWAEIDRDAHERMVLGVGGRRGRNIDAVLRVMLEEQLKYRRILDQEMAQVASAPSGPMLTDENLDTRWLATPWSTLRRIGGLSSDAEAKRRVLSEISGGL
jgi:hypothetical protein